MPAGISTICESREGKNKFMRRYHAACLSLIAGLLLRTLNASAGCDSASVQAIAPSSSTITSAVEQTNNATRYCKIDALINTDLVLRDVIHHELDWPDRTYWNSRFLFASNSGFAGWIALNLGNLSFAFAVAETDTGHSGTGRDAAWALNLEFRF
jgi:hypothetical protein